MRNLKDNIRSVRRDLLVAQVKGEISWSLKQTCRLPHVCSLAVTLLHKKGPCHRGKTCANSDCIPTSHKCRCQRIKYELYFYISKSSSLFVQWYDIQHYAPQMSIDQIRMVSHSKRLEQVISHRNYYWCKQCRWSSASFNCTCSSQISVA